MAPFDLEAALEGKLVVLRNGVKANVLYDMTNHPFHKQGTHQLFGVFETGAKATWCINGKFLLTGENPCDIVGMWEEPHPLAELPIGSPILVRYGENLSWLKRHFVGLTPNKEVIVWSYGHSAWTADGGLTSVLPYYRLPTEQELAECRAIKE